MRARQLALGVVAVLVGALVVAAGTPARDAAANGVDATFSDTFERADGQVGNGWTALRGTWAIAAGSVVATGPDERLIVRAADVGPAYTVSTSLTLTPVSTGHAWSGVATNILDHGNGTQSYYALRIGQNTTEAAAGNAPWQLVRIDHSAPATETSVLARGFVTAAAGSRLTLSVQVTDGATVAVRVTGGSTPVARTATIRTIDRLASGRAGLYSQSGTNPLHDFSMQTSTDAAYTTFADDFGRADGTVGNGWRKGRGSWTIRDGGVFPTGDSERLMYHSSVTLGDTFTATTSLTLPSPATSTRSWTGVAVNITDHGDGTQTFYALRVAQSTAEGNSPQWQVVTVTRSQSPTLLRGGRFAAAPGSTLNLTLTSRNRGTGLEVGITGPGITPVNEYVNLPASGRLSAGRAGVYNNAGALGVNDFSVVASTRAPSPPTSFPALNCDAGLPDDYPLPSTRYEVDPQVTKVDDTWAGHSVGRAILTSGDDQYVAYYNADRVMTVAKRTLPSTTWTRKNLDSVLGWDSHNYVTMALDSAGHLHVSGNMHAVPLVYYRTTRAGDVTSLTRVTTMVDPALERSATYPRFLTAPDGALLFNYRNGSSSSGAYYYNRYDPATRTWSPFLSTPLSDGQGLRNGYDTGFVRGPDGWYHLGIVWRDTGDAGTSSMPSYLRSRDLLHWEDSAGNPVALPATYATADVIDPVPIFGGVVNNNLKIGFDAAGQVLTVYAKYDANVGNQIYVARPDGRGNWTRHQVSDFTGQWWIAGGGTLTFQLGIGGISALPDGKLRIDYSCRGVGGRVLVVDPATMTAVADVPAPRLPAAITTPRSTYPGIGVATATSSTSDGLYVLRWETLGSNQDQPRDEWPPAQPLEVYLLRPVSA